MPGTNAYIFLGPELGQKQDAVAGIRKKLQEKGPLEEFLFYAGENSAQEIADTVRNHGLFAQSKLCIVKNADQIKKKDELALIASCMERLNSDSAMILISDELKLPAGIDDCCRKENRQVFYEMFENRKGPWLENFFRQAGRKVSADAIDLILELVENNTDALKRECSRLIAFLPADRPVRPEDIEKWLSHNREESAFTLFSRIAACDKDRAVESLHTLLAAKESPQALFAGLLWCFRKLRGFHGLLREGKADNGFEMKKLGLSSPKAKTDYAFAARHFDEAAVDGCMAITARYDILTRSSGSALEDVLMDMYLMEIFGAGR